MLIVDYEDLLDRLQYLVGFNPGAGDTGGFYGDATNPNLRLGQALNDAYQEEVELGKQNGSRRAFQFTHSMTWAADAATQAIPKELEHHQILEIRDDTDVASGEVGTTLGYYHVQQDADGLSTEDRNTWRLRPVPSAAKTLTILYMANAEPLVEDADEPTLIPLPLRQLLVWTAGINLYEIGRHKVPQGWHTKQRDLRFLFWKRLALGRPIGYPASSTVTNRENF